MSRRKLLRLESKPGGGRVVAAHGTQRSGDQVVVITGIDVVVAGRITRLPPPNEARAASQDLEEPEGAGPPDRHAGDAPAGGGRDEPDLRVVEVAPDGEAEEADVVDAPEDDGVARELVERHDRSGFQPQDFFDEQFGTAEFDPQIQFDVLQAVERRPHGVPGLGATGHQLNFQLLA